MAIGDVVDDIRSGMTFVLLNWAMTIAPKREKLSLAVSVSAHVKATIKADGQKIHIAKCQGATGHKE